MLVAATLVVAASCGGSPGSGEDDVETSLTFTVTPKEGAEPRRATLGCPGGDEAACSALDKLDPKVFEPVPKDQICTMILGGPQSATVKGTLDGEWIDASFDQKNGCEIARWKKLTPVLEALDLL